MEYYGIAYDIKIEDVQAVIDMTHNMPRGILDGDYNYNQYHTYDEVSLLLHYDSKVFKFQLEYVRCISVLAIFLHW